MVCCLSFPTSIAQHPSAMRPSSIFTTVFGLLATAGAQQWPVHDNGLNDVVQWDHYSLIVNNERVFLWSGEFHYWRLPVPELWIGNYIRCY